MRYWIERQIEICKGSPFDRPLDGDGDPPWPLHLDPRLGAFNEFERDEKVGESAFGYVTSNDPAVVPKIIRSSARTA
jgi:hypothetical protein